MFFHFTISSLDIAIIVTTVVSFLFAAKKASGKFAKKMFAK